MSGMTNKQSGWRNENDDEDTQEMTSSLSMVSPNTFHKSSKRLDVSKSAEKREIEQAVKVNKNDYDIRLKVFRKITTYKKWPLQELAFKDLAVLMDAHLQGHLETNTAVATCIQNFPLEDSIQSGSICKEWEDASHEISVQSMEEPKRTKSFNVDITSSTSPHKLLKEKYRKEFEAEMALQRSSDSSMNVIYKFLDPIWCMEPRIFAVEKSTTGKRYYVVAQLGRFMDHYWRVCDPASRHYYEVIQENTPCRLYFDLEYIKSYNTTLTDENGEILLEEFILELCAEIKQRFNIEITRQNIVDLDSSTEKKFSRHLIVHFPNGQLFSNTSSCGRFVKNFIGRLAEEVATSELSSKCPTLYHYLFVWKEETVAQISTEEETKLKLNAKKQSFIDKKKTCFVDLGVYTKNRLFRILGSCKYGKPVTAALRIASSNEFPLPKLNLSHDKCKLDEAASESFEGAIAERKELAIRRMKDRNYWERHGIALGDSLVVPPNYSKISYEILQDLDENPDPHFMKIGTKTIQRETRSSSYGQSTFPCLDEFILSTLATRGGIVGSIRAWTISPGINDETSTGFITYHMKDNRWCEYIGRAHKGNNIMWHISIKDMTYWQTCHDPDCRSAGFRGQVNALPDHIQEQLKDALLEKAIEIDDEFEKALMALSINDVKESKDEDEEIKIDNSDSLNILAEPVSLTVSSTVGYDNNVQQVTSPLGDTNILDLSFEEALNDYIKTNPSICP